MLLPHYEPILQNLESELTLEKQVSCKVLRLDLIDEHIGGNKLFKLKYNLQRAIEQQLPVLTFGGAYSNHIIATAKACVLNHIPCTGIIRGDEEKELNPLLLSAKNFGMKLHFVSRDDYRKRENENFLSSLQLKFGKHFIIHEGGANEMGVKGSMEILSPINEEFDFILLPVGSGGTLAGLALSANHKTQLLGIAVLKGENYLESLVRNLTQGKSTSRWSINHNYHFGGYAKWNTELKNFISQFQNENKIPLEPVYSGKLFYALNDLIGKDFFPPRTKILCIHTGGIFSF